MFGAQASNIHPSKQERMVIKLMKFGVAGSLVIGLATLAGPTAMTETAVAPVGQVVARPIAVAKSGGAPRTAEAVRFADMGNGKNWLQGGGG
jgi:hypothetical protein